MHNLYFLPSLDIRQLDADNLAMQLGRLTVCLAPTLLFYNLSSCRLVGIFSQSDCP